MKTVHYLLGWFYYLSNCLFHKDHKELFYLENKEIFNNTTFSMIFLSIALTLFSFASILGSNRTSVDFMSGWRYTILLIPLMFWVSIMTIRLDPNKSVLSRMLFVSSTLGLVLLMDVPGSPNLISWHKKLVIDLIFLIPLDMPQWVINQLFVLGFYLFNLTLSMTFLFALKVIFIDLKLIFLLEYSLKKLNELLTHLSVPKSHKPTLAKAPKNFKIKGHETQAEKHLEDLL